MSMSLCMVKVPRYLYLKVGSRVKKTGIVNGSTALYLYNINRYREKLSDKTVGLD